MEILKSSFPIGSNAAKSLLFRLSAFFLELAILKIHAIITFRRNAFTAYLMSFESTIQKLIFSFTPTSSESGRKGRCSIIILLFFVVFAGLYDTMLWGLDFPGTVSKAYRVPASELNGPRDLSADYVVHTKGIPGIIAGIDLTEGMSKGLWKGGTNATLTGEYDVGNAHISPGGYLPNDPHPGPRIWLDEDGWSIALDYNPSLFCNTSWRSPVERWACRFNMSEKASTKYQFKELARPTVWWNTRNPDAGWWDSSAEIGGNPWAELGGRQHETVAMRQILTVTKGIVRHVFLLSALKVSMLGVVGGELSSPDMVDLIWRTWPERVPNNTTYTPWSVISEVLAARANDSGLSIGWGTVQEGGFVLTSHSYIYGTDLYMRPEGNTAENNTGSQAGTHYFRIQSSSLRLLRTEKVPGIPTPAEPCSDKPYVSVANGGFPRYTTCYRIRKFENTSNIGLLGQFDTSAIYILADTLGRAYAKNSSRSLIPNAYQWYLEHQQELDRLVISRGYITGSNASAVTVIHHVTVPALSPLQLILAAAALFLATILYGLGWYLLPPGYRSTLLASLTASIEHGYQKHVSLGYVVDPPEIGILETGEAVRIVTRTGSFGHNSEIEKGLNLAMDKKGPI